LSSVRWYSREINFAIFEKNRPRTGNMLSEMHDFFSNNCKDFVILLDSYSPWKFE